MKSNRKKTDKPSGVRNNKKEVARKASPTKGFGLLDVIKEAGTVGLAVKNIFKALNLTSAGNKQECAEKLQELVKDGEVKITLDGNFAAVNAKASGDTAEGIVDFVNARFAFIICEGIEEDIMVSAKEMSNALDGDRVLIALWPRHKRDKRQEGSVLQVLKRKREEFVGKVQLSDRFAFVIPDSKKLHFDIFIKRSDLKGAKDGEKVVVKITRWHDEHKKNPEGEITQVLGMAGENDTEMHAILAEYGLPDAFPESVEEEAKILPKEITAEEIKKRRDFRNITTFTIDPEDAKDFDDALSYRVLDNGNIEVGVHIADVTHYVRPGTDLEKEAYKRATSVYLVDRVVPMLPEVLSNGLCSLRPNEDKLTFSAVFELDNNAKIVSEWFGKTIIHSDRRFSYEQAQEILEGNDGDFKEEILSLNKLAYKLRDVRFKSGSIAFETVEIKFKLDENGKPLGVYQKVRKDAHKLIEDFMLLANKRVAQFVFDLVKHKDDKLTMVYRTHGDPDPDKLSMLSQFAFRFGHKVNLEENGNIPQKLNQLALETEGRPEQNVIQSLAIRAMAKAIYSVKADKHFGLGFEHYSHFTSPIRRYPDMMAHRLLQQYLEKKMYTDPKEYEEKCKHSSEREKLAADAERASTKYKQVEFMTGTIGRIFEGIVSGIQEFGVFVEINETKCEGLIRMPDMTDDFYEFDEKNYKVVGRKSGKTYTLGDKIVVKVKATDLEKRTIDLLLINE
jgi:ribonuclease R